MFYSRIIKYIYFLFVLICSGGGSAYYGNKSGILYRLAAAGLVMLLYKIKFDRKLVHALLVWGLFVGVCSALHRFLFTMSLFYYGMLFIEAYTLIRLFGSKIIKVYVRFVTILAAVSLVGWSLQMINNNAMMDFFGQFNISGGFREDVGDYIHVIFYTLNSDVSVSTYGLIRNCGFCWEPGSFSVYLVFAIYFRLSLLKKPLFTPASWILYSALATTLSTTGYIALFAYAIYSLMVKSKRLIYIVPLLISLWGAYFAYQNLAFLGKKVGDVSQVGVAFARTDKYSAEFIAGGRLSGLPLVIQDLVRNPVLGKALASEGEYSNVGTIVSAHLNGLFNIASSMGLLGLLSLLYFVYLSSKRFNYLFDVKVKYAFMLVFVITSFGFVIYTMSMIFCFVLFGYFIKAPEADQIGKAASSART
jgi:hypothetical protein